MEVKVQDSYEQHMQECPPKARQGGVATYAAVRFGQLGSTVLSA